MSLESFRSQWQNYLRLDLTEDAVARADALAWEYNLRGYDAVHLACALIWQEEMQEPVTLATFDKQLWRAAKSVGLIPFPADLIENTDSQGARTSNRKTASMTVLQAGCGGTEMDEYKNPFPGMDPYLETPDIWPDFHDALAAQIRADLNARLPQPYYARLQMRPELGIVLEAGTRHWIVPDVVVVRQPRFTPPPSGEGDVAVLEHPRSAVAEGIEMRVHTDPLQHRFVEIRDAARGHKLITLIEIVSPSNKRPGPDRRAYEAKQREVLESDANLIELDLLRSGTRLLPYPDLAAAVDKLACDYLILLNRSALRQDYWMDYTLYPVDVREPLPCIPVPLAGQDPDVPLDLQIAAQRAHREGPYLRAIDYSQPAEPPLSEEDAAWVDARLRAVRLRG